MSKINDLNDLIKQAQKQGWSIDRTKNNHYKWLSPLGRFFFSSGTPSDHRALKNIQRDLRKYGFIEIKKGK